MARWNIHRRTLLRGMLGAGAVSIGLPLFEAFLDPPLSAGSRARADVSTYPRRMGWWLWGNGVLKGNPDDPTRLPELWNPARVGLDDYDAATNPNGWELSPLLEPLAAHKSKLIVLTNFSVLTTNTDPHGSGPAGLFTGDNLTPQTDGVARTGTVIGPSFDQIVASALADSAPTPFRSLEVGVQRSTGALSYTGPFAPNPPETSPAALFRLLFGEGFRAPGGPLDPRLGLRASVLDAVRDQSTRLSRRLGASDRARLDQHLEGVRALERQLELLQADRPDFPACMAPTEEPPDPEDIEGRPQMELRNQLISDLVAMALACDQTRVFSVMYSQPVNNTLFEGITSGHHQLTHDEPDPQPEVRSILGQIMRDYAYFLTALDRLPEGDGTLLDHCAVLGTSDVSSGRDHSIDDYPLLIAGSCAGAFRTNRHIRPAGGDNATKVTLALINTMLDSAGLPSFGQNAGLVTSPVDLGEPSP